METGYAPAMKLFYFAGSVALIMFPCLLQAAHLEILPEDSQLLVEVKASPPHTFTSQARTFLCAIEIDPESLEVNSASCVFRFADLDSQKDKRDRKMRDWMDTDHYPEARFDLESIVTGEQGTVGKGVFSMHGMEKKIEVPFSVHREGDRVILDGEATIDYRDWNLDIIRLVIFRVNPVIHPRFHLEGILTQEKS